MYKRIVRSPAWLEAPHVVDVYSVSDCISSDFADLSEYNDLWRHNDHWFFDSPGVLRAVAEDLGVSLEGLELLYYEGHELQFDADTREWLPYGPEPSPSEGVLIPAARTLLGFDVATFSGGTRPECSPLSCNSLAAELSTNEHCLFATLDAALRALDDGRFDRSEPGPFRVIAVYAVHDG
jgi:hypothetical protein